MKYTNKWNSMRERNLVNSMYTIGYKPRNTNNNRKRKNIVRKFYPQMPLINTRRFILSLLMKKGNNLNKIYKMTNITPYVNSLPYFNNPEANKIFFKRPKRSFKNVAKNVIRTKRLRLNNRAV